MTDSRIDTYEHIHNVQLGLAMFIAELTNRMLLHDATKLESPEKEAYDGLGERLREHEYGSEGYRAVLREMKPAIQHHYAGGRHHPEHFEDGIQGMNLIDLSEMIVDWVAASKRQPNGDVYKSMDHNQQRWGFSDDLKQILINTVDFIHYPELHSQR